LVMMPWMQAPSVGAVAGLPARLPPAASAPTRRRRMRPCAMHSGRDAGPRIPERTLMLLLTYFRPWHCHHNQHGRINRSRPGSWYALLHSPARRDKAQCPSHGDVVLPQCGAAFYCKAAVSAGESRCLADVAS
jgi:hypothetical protein